MKKESYSLPTGYLNLLQSNNSDPTSPNSTDSYPTPPRGDRAPGDGGLPDQNNHPLITDLNFTESETISSNDHLISKTDEDHIIKPIMKKNGKDSSYKMEIGNGGIQMEDGFHLVDHETAHGLALTPIGNGSDPEAPCPDGEVCLPGGDPGDGRETWDKKVDFLLSIIGFAVDLANVWRFPSLCYKNGGGAFLIPYFIVLIFCAVPLFFMELVLGQFHRQGAIGVWKIVPIFRGVGICQCLIAFYVAFYYNVIIAWSMYYLTASLTHTLPWTGCNNTWNTPNCLDRNYSADPLNLDNYTLADMANRTSAAAEYFEREVLGLHLSPGLEDIGPPRWRLVLCLMAVFTIIYLSLWKGIKSSGKVVWVTATMPYVVLSCLLIRGLLLPGAKDGILYYITPRMSKLREPQIWIDAAVQIFYSVGAGFGVHIAFASYNQFNANCYRDCLATVCVNSFTSLFSGFVIFSYLGYMSFSQNKDIDKVVDEGAGLTFVVYPEAIATLPGSVAWAIIFFFMLLTLGIDSAMGGLEAVLTGLSDVWRDKINSIRFGRELITFCVVSVAFLLSIPNVTNGGVYLVTIWDNFAAGISILFGVLVQAIAIGWFYGLDQFCRDVQKMLGFWPNIYWRVCWKFISPLTITIIVIWSITSIKPLTYSSYTKGEYIYPTWANGVGWLIAASSMIFVPIVAIYTFTQYRGTIKQRVALCISPQWEHRAIMDGGRPKRFQSKHWTAL